MSRVEKKCCAFFFLHAVARTIPFWVGLCLRLVCLFSNSRIYMRYVLQLHRVDPLKLLKYLKERGREREGATQSPLHYSSNNNKNNNNQICVIFLDPFHTRDKWYLHKCSAIIITELPNVIAFFLSRFLTSFFDAEEGKTHEMYNRVWFVFEFGLCFGWMKDAGDGQFVDDIRAMCDFLRLTALALNLRFSVRFHTIADDWTHKKNWYLLLKRCCPSLCLIRIFVQSRRCLNHCCKRQCVISKIQHTKRNHYCFFSSFVNVQCVEFNDERKKTIFFVANEFWLLNVK